MRETSPFWLTHEVLGGRTPCPASDLGQVMAFRKIDLPVQRLRKTLPDTLGELLVEDKT
jgi:hypothetical protein